MPTWREIGLVYGGAHIGRGISKALDQMDAALGATGKKALERPSFWATVAVSVGVPIVAALAERRVRGAAARALLMAGVAAAAAVSTKIWDYIEELLLGVAAPAVVPPRVPTAPPKPPAPPRAPPTPPPPAPPAPKPKVPAKYEVAPAAEEVAAPAPAEEVAPAAEVAAPAAPAPPAEEVAAAEVAAPTEEVTAEVF